MYELHIEVWVSYRLLKIYPSNYLQEDESPAPSPPLDPPARPLPSRAESWGRRSLLGWLVGQCVEFLLPTAARGVFVQVCRSGGGGGGVVFGLRSSVLSRGGWLVYGALRAVGDRC